MNAYEQAAQVVAKELNKPISELTEGDILAWRRKHGVNGAWTNLSLELQNIRVAMWAGLDFNTFVDFNKQCEYSYEFPEKCKGIGIADCELIPYKMTGWPEPDLEGIQPTRKLVEELSLEEEAKRCAEWKYYKKFEEEHGRKFDVSVDGKPDKYAIDRIHNELSAFDIFEYRASTKLKVDNQTMFVIELSDVVHEISKKEVPSVLQKMYCELALSFQMLHHAASLLDIDFVWLDSVRQPLPNNFSDEWERCYTCLVRAKEYLDSVGAKYPGDFTGHWDKCNELYKSKMYVVNLCGCYDYHEIEKIRKVCKKYGMNVESMSDAELWQTLVL